MFVMPVVAFMVAGIFMNGDISGATAAAYGGMIPVDIVSYIAAWVLAIIARAKFKSKFALILLIIYGILLALGIIGVIVLLGIFIGMV
jgi:hypothetical protein